MTWRKACIVTGIIKNATNTSNKYQCALYSSKQLDSVGDIYVDDVSVRRLNFRIGISNDRDEVFDYVNVVYEINGYKDNYNLKDFELTTKIKDNNTNVYYNKKTDISSLFFTKKISVKNLKVDNFYYVESIFKNNKDNITDISSYSFKKINKIKRNVTIDQYGRMFVNEELFFPFGISLSVRESDLMLINKTHLNFITPSSLLNKKTMDMIYTTQQGKIKVLYHINKLYNLDHNTCTNLNDEENYKQLVDKINEIKDHPNLLAWYISDTMHCCFNQFLRNRTLTIHQLDPNHPTFLALNAPGEINQLMNTTDIMPFYCYPIGREPIRRVNKNNDEANREILEAKLLILIIQIFDWGVIFRITENDLIFH